MYAFVIIPRPKTRRLAARQQTARIDPVDAVRLITATFARLQPADRLWPLSLRAFRSRFEALLSALGLPTKGENSGGGRPLELPSLRGGGATALLQATEDSELVRRRGRWMNVKTMELYLQELAAVSLVPNLAPATRARIKVLSDASALCMARASELLDSDVPAHLWPQLFRES